MGQRHQLFVIARVNGRYRTLAAVHHQWLYGQTALKRCRGTLELLQHPGSQIAVQQELIGASRYDEAFWEGSSAKDSKENIESVPFPYIMTCLMLGASFGPSDGHISRVLIEPFHMKYNEGDNNNGITIFDVTDTSRVRYCFVDYYGMESPRAVQLMAPLSARTYLEAYYELADPKHKEVLVPLVESFAAWGLIPSAVLEDAWPGEGWEEPDDEQDVRATTEPTIASEELRISSKGDPASLRDRAMEQLVQSLLNDPVNELSSLPEAELLPDFYASLKSQLYGQASSLKPSRAHIELLFEALKNDVQVDLSPFRNFCNEEISILTSKLAKNGKLAVSNLSNMPQLTDKDIQTILGPEVVVQSIYLINSPNVSIDTLVSLDKSCDLYHSGLYKRAIADNRSERDRDSYDYRPLPRLDFSTKMADPVVQLVWIGVDQSQVKDPALRRPDGALAWDALTSDNTVPAYMSLRRETSLQYKKFPLVDTPLPMARVITGLSHLLKWGSMADMMGTFQFSTGAAGCFSMPASLPSGQALAVAPLSTELYLRNSGDGNSLRQDTAPEEPDLEPGQWAIILIHECFNVPSQAFLEENKSPEDIISPRKRLRYALVSPSGDGFTVADVPAYLQHVIARDSSNTTLPAEEKSLRPALCQQLRQWWEHNFKASDSMGFYERDDIHDILNRVYLCAPEDNMAPEREEESMGDMVWGQMMSMMKQMKAGDA